jgi:hypothetical protein
MQSKDIQQLEEAYQRVYIKEDAQDTAEDNQLKSLLGQYLLNTIKKEQCTEYNVSQIVDRIMEMLQAHMAKSKTSPVAIPEQ